MRYLLLIVFVISLIAVSIASAQPPVPLGKGEPVYTPLSTHWDYVGSFDSGFNKLAAVVVCFTQRPGAGHLIAADSSGQVAEWRYDDGNWVQMREFSVGEEIVGAIPAAPHQDFIWRVYVSTRSGKILELERADMGWVIHEIAQFKGPILNLQSSDPGNGGISQLMVIDADSSVTNLWVSDRGDWIPRPMPDIKGGATEVCFNYERTGLEAIICGVEGVVYKCVQDTMGYWTKSAWTRLSAGVLDMAASADPSMRDMALFYSGLDGIFRYLHYEFKDDVTSRVPAAGATTFVIGKGRQRRFNEFFGLNGDEFCMFEFEYGDQAWHREPITKLTSPVTHVEFGPGRGEKFFQMYIATADGQIHELYRGPADPDEAEMEMPKGPEDW